MILVWAVWAGQLQRKRIERYIKMKANNAAADDLDDDDDSMESDSQESLIKSILGCKNNIGNLDGVHVQQKELLGSTLHDASIIGKH
jgi:hypothetical protein